MKRLIFLGAIFTLLAATLFIMFTVVRPAKADEPPISCPAGQKLVLLQNYVCDQFAEDGVFCTNSHVESEQWICDSPLESSSQQAPTEASTPEPTVEAPPAVTSTETPTPPEPTEQPTYTPTQVPDPVWTPAAAEPLHTWF